MNDIPLGKLGTVDDSVSIALFLCSYLSDFLNGDTIRINGDIYMGGRPWLDRKASIYRKLFKATA